MRHQNSKIRRKYVKVVIGVKQQVNHGIGQVLHDKLSALELAMVIHGLPVDHTEGGYIPDVVKERAARLYEQAKHGE